MPTENQCLSAVPDVANICSDYFGTLDIDLKFFGHTTVFPDGRFHFLCSRREWPEYGFVKEEVPPAGFTIYDKLENSIMLPHIRSGIELGWSDEEMRIAKEQFGITKLMAIFRKYDEHYQGFFFDLHDKKAHEQYINKFDIFENFIFYYKDRARDLLKMASKNQLQVNEKYLDVHRNGAAFEKKNTLESNDRKELIPKQYFLTHKGKEYCISAREYQCLSLISHGKKIKDLANTLKISPRTIDTHLISLKRKLNVRSLTETVEIYWANRIRGSRHE